MSGSNFDHPTQYGKPDPAQFASGHSVEAWVNQLESLRYNLWEAETPDLIEALRGNDLVARGEALQRTKQILGRMAKWNKESSKGFNDAPHSSLSIEELDTHPRAISWPLAETAIQLSRSHEPRAKKDLAELMNWLNGGSLPMPGDRTMYPQSPWYDSQGQLTLEPESKQNHEPEPEHSNN